MPLYEFECHRCREKFEKLCRSGVDSLRCPACGSEAKRIFSTFCSARSSSGGGCGG